VEASLLTPLTRKEEQAVLQAAEEFGKFLGLEAVFSHQESHDRQRKTRSF
jgi:hypothetical protein